MILERRESSRITLAFSMMDPVGEEKHELVVKMKKSEFLECVLFREEGLGWDLIESFF